MLMLWRYVAVAVMAVGIGLIAANNLHAEEGKRGGSLTVMSGPIPNLDPMGASAAAGYVYGQIFGSLTRLDPEWTPQPYLAESWDISPDGMTMTFHLDPKAKFHDGKPVTSADVAFSLSIAQKHHRFGPQMFGPIEKVETPDQNTAVFRLSEPHAAAMLSTSVARFLPILPKHVYGDGQEYTTHPAHAMPVGSGPFKVNDASLPEYVILERFDEYLREGLPYLDQIIFRVVRDQTAIRVGLEQEDFHLAVASSTMRYRDLKKFQELDHLKIDQCCFANGSILVIDINNRRPPLDDKRVRKALRLAIDYEFIVNKLHDGWTKRPIGPIVSSSPFADKEAGPLPTDLEEAKRLLDEAGYPAKADGTRFELSILHASHYRDLFVTVPEYLVPAMKRVGIKLNREQMPDRTSWSKRMGDWDYALSMTLPGNYVDPTIGVSRVYVCDNIKHVAYTNTSGYCNEEVDALFEKAAREPDFEKRKQLYAQVQRLLVEETPVIWALETPSPMIYHAGLANPPLAAWGPSGPMDETYWKAAPND